MAAPVQVSGNSGRRTQYESRWGHAYQLPGVLADLKRRMFLATSPWSHLVAADLMGISGELLCRYGVK